MPIVDPRFMAHQRRRLTRPDAYRYVRRGEPPAQSDIEAGWASSACRTEERQRPSAGQGLRRLAEARCDLARLKTSLNAIRMRLAIGRSIAARKYSPDQPRVPAGEPGGGRWTDGGGAGDQADNNLQIATEAPRNDPRVISDASPEIIWTPGAQYARNVLSESDVATSSVHAPAHIPPSVDIDENIEEAEAHKSNYLWFYAQVRNKGPWDYKQQGGEYADFGNFNYGVTGAAAGFAEATLLRVAGWAQVRAGTSRPEWGAPVSLLQALLGVGGQAPYGDDPQDQYWISQGIKYYRLRRSRP